VVSSTEGLVKLFLSLLTKKKGGLKLRTGKWEALHRKIAIISGSIAVVVDTATQL